MLRFLSQNHKIAYYRWLGHSILLAYFIFFTYPTEKLYYVEKFQINAQTVHFGGGKDTFWSNIVTSCFCFEPQILACHKVIPGVSPDFFCLADIAIELNCSFCCLFLLPVYCLFCFTLLLVSNLIFFALADIAIELGVGFGLAHSFTVLSSHLRILFV